MIRPLTCQSAYRQANTRSSAKRSPVEPRSSMFETYYSRPHVGKCTVYAWFCDSLIIFRYVRGLNRGIYINHLSLMAGVDQANECFTMFTVTCRSGWCIVKRAICGQCVATLCLFQADLMGHSRHRSTVQCLAAAVHIVQTRQAAIYILE